MKEQQGGSGSSEQTGRGREDQKAQHTELNTQERKDIAAEAGIGRKKLADASELGAGSGREDLAGGSGDRMESEDSGSETDRPGS